MIHEHGIHPAHDAAVAAHELRHALRELAGDGTYPDRVGLALAANVQDQVADALDRHWKAIRPFLDVACNPGGETDRHRSVEDPVAQAARGRARRAAGAERDVPPKGTETSLSTRRTAYIGPGEIR